ncbi:Hypothetical_protein [Hexamita inflata]|uniref:Hypothetical_protein n=1 Tax=Hexamita inflata TaxID=28002 RepID=A0AA86Q7L2_9EUKA|nr:Hypothetical protein HINF_LOCUS35124 [Hexamita inflata]
MNLKSDSFWSSSSELKTESEYLRRRSVWFVWSGCVQKYYLLFQIRFENQNEKNVKIMNQLFIIINRNIKMQKVGQKLVFARTRIYLKSILSQAQCSLNK